MLGSLYLGLYSYIYVYLDERIKPRAVQIRITQPQIEQQIPIQPLLVLDT